MNKTNDTGDTSSNENEINYTQEQEEIISSGVGYFRIFAPAGGGKSTTEIELFGYLTGLNCPEGMSQPTDPIPPDRVLFVLFGDDDERAIREKLQDRYGTQGTMPTVVNYNSLGEQLKQEYRYLGHGSPDSQLLDETERDRLLADIATSISPTGIDGITNIPTGYKKKLLGRVIELAKAQGYTPGELAVALPDQEQLEAAAALLSKLQHGSSFDPDSPEIEKSPQVAIDATLSGLTSVSDEAARLSSDLGDGRFERLLAASLEQVNDICTGQQDFLDQYGKAADGSVRITWLRVSRYIVSTACRTEGYASYAINGLADQAVYRLPLQPAWWTVRALWLASELQPGYAIYENHLASMDPPRHDYGDQVAHAVALLRENDEIRELEAGRYDLVLADEFQDTSPGDFELIKQFGDTTPVVACGDEAQNVFMFRGTTKKIFEETFNEIYNSIDYHLTMNFRTYKQDLLDVVNTVSGQIEGFEPMVSWHAKNGEVPSVIDDIPSVRYTTLSYDKETNEEDTVKLVMNRIENILEGNNIPTLDSDCPTVAVAFRSNSMLGRLREALDADEYEYYLLGGAEQALPKLVQLRLDALRVATDTADYPAVQRLLNFSINNDSAFLDELPEEGMLESFLSNDRLSAPIVEIQDAIQDLRSVARRQSLSQLVDASVNTLGLPDPKTPREKELCRNLYELLRQRPDDDIFEASARLDIVKETLKKSISLGSAIDADIVIGSIHLMKGREADYVIAPGLYPHIWRPRRSPVDVLQYAGAVRSKEIESILDTDFVSRTLQEERRVLHVLLTRARVQLHVIGDSWSADLRNGSPPRFPIRNTLPDGFDYDTVPWFDPYGEVKDACQDLGVGGPWSPDEPWQSQNDAQQQESDGQ